MARVTTPKGHARVVKKVCDFSSFVRSGRGRSESDRRYTAIGVMVARFVMGRRSKFALDDVKFKRGVGLDYKVARSWAKEFLSSWEEGAEASHSRLADEMLASCPQLHDKVVKHWDGA